MELVELYDNKRRKLNKVKERWDLIQGEYKQSVHLFIVNDKKELLIQKRSPNKKTFPNMWSVTGGAVNQNESSLEAVIRECKEEIGIDASIEKLELMLSIKYRYNFTDVWLLKQSFNIENVVLQKEEVEDAKWAKVEEVQEMIKENKFAPNISLYFEMFMKLIKS